MKRNSINLKLATVISMGFFSILAQTLLFRNFLIVFDGNELSIGIFFFTWLIWVCAGAYIAKIKQFVRLSNLYPLLLLIYIPCFILQYFAFLNAQSILGVHFFELIALHKIVLFIFCFNAPVSLLTGFLFVTAVKWIKSKDLFIPVIKIYMCEAFGSFIGALTVTLLLYFAFIEEFVCVIGIIILIITVAPHIFAYKSQKIKILYFILVIFCLFAVYDNYPSKINSKINRIKWDELVQGGKYLGSFSTPQAKYIYGEYKKEFIVTSSNSVYEAFPNHNASCNIVGEYLSQSPNAENVLVIGPGTFSICNVLSKIQQIKNITWLDTDPQYSKELQNILLHKKNRYLSKVVAPKEDVRKYLTSTKNKFDLVILHLQAPSNLLLNRYFSYEFFEQIKGILSNNGVVGIGFPGGENFLGPELSLLGGSILYTIRNVFHNIILMPGAESVFFVAKKKGLVTDSGNTLSKQLQSIKGIEQIYSPDQIKSAYEKNRIDFQMSIYENILKQYPGNVLLNTDKSPKSFLYSLLLSVKTLSNVSFSTHGIYSVLKITFFVFVFIVAIYFLLRLFFYYAYHRNKMSKHKVINAPCKFDLYMSVYIAAIVGMGLNLLLLFLFQINFGTVYLCFGLITAFFMLGMAKCLYY
jgi:spermidine synthase